MSAARRSLGWVALLAAIVLALSPHAQAPATADAGGAAASAGGGSAVPQPSYPGGASSWKSSRSFIDALSDRLWADRGLRKKRLGRGVSAGEFDSLERARTALLNDERERALRILKRAAASVYRLSHEATLTTYRFLLQLAEQHVAAGELDQAGVAYQEALMLGPYLPAEHTVDALNRLIKTYFDMREYEAALMFVRVGVAVLDDVGAVPYLAMNRIIEEMASLDDALADLEYDFDAAVDRLETAALAAEQRGLVIEDQWWAPVYEARDDRERAVALLKDILAWQPEHAMRGAARAEDAAAQSP